MGRTHALTGSRPENGSSRELGLVRRGARELDFCWLPLERSLLPPRVSRRAVREARRRGDPLPNVKYIDKTEEPRVPQSGPRQRRKRSPHCFVAFANCYEHGRRNVAQPHRRDVRIHAARE